MKTIVFALAALAAGATQAAEFYNHGPVAGVSSYSLLNGGTDSDEQQEQATPYAVNYNAVEPVIVVPEPSTYALLLGGLALIGLIRRPRAARVLK